MNHIRLWALAYSLVITSYLDTLYYITPHNITLLQYRQPQSSTHAIDAADSSYSYTLCLSIWDPRWESIAPSSDRHQMSESWWIWLSNKIGKWSKWNKLDHMADENENGAWVSWCSQVYHWSHTMPRPWCQSPRLKELEHQQHIHLDANPVQYYGATTSSCQPVHYCPQNVEELGECAWQ